MKKALSVLITAAMTLALTSCGSPAEPTPAEPVSQAAPVDREAAEAALAKAHEHLDNGDVQAAYNELLRAPVCDSVNDMRSYFAYVPLSCRADDGDTASYSYEDGRCVRATVTYGDGSGYTCEYTYDADGRPISKQQDGDVVRYTYDENGRCLTEEVSTDGEVYLTIRYTYRGNLLRSEERTEENGDCTTIDYTYDEDGRLVSFVRSSESALYSREDLYEYTYDADGRLLCRTINKEAANARTAVYTYDQNGNRIKAQHKNSQGEYQYQYTYGEDGRCLSCVYTDDNTVTTTSYEWELVYYPHGVPETVTDLIQEALHFET